jgi:hypothetical protein
MRTKLTSLLWYCRPTFLLGLTITHITLFGLPAIRRFQEASVTVEEQMEAADSLPAPAITLCPFEVNFHGWKNITPEMANNFETMYQDKCADAESTQEFVDCVEQKTFSLNETIAQGATHGVFSSPIDLAEPKFWTVDTTTAVQGRCHTLNYTSKIGSNIEKDAILMKLDLNLSYFAFIHSHDFFLVTFNPLTLPTHDLVLDPAKMKSSFKSLVLKVVREGRIDREGQRCNLNPDYGFTLECSREGMM